MFKPKYLNAEQQEQILSHWLTEQEAKVAQAWLAYQMTPADAVAQAAYEQQAGYLGQLEAEQRRWAGEGE